MEIIDTNFCFWDDSRGKDPDKFSPTLRRYHKALWSKELPTGQRLDLDDAVAGVYLLGRVGEHAIKFSSDAMIPTYYRHGVEWIDESDFVRTRFWPYTYTMGGMIIFPSERYHAKMTINGARGFHRKIGDRIDLTLECIRRHYAGASSPLDATLTRYRPFFDLFADFKGFVEFFLLQDLVDDDFRHVRFLLPFDGFTSSPRPADTTLYAQYAENCFAFLNARNDRIDDYCERLG